METTLKPLGLPLGRGWVAGREDNYDSCPFLAATPRVILL